MTLFTIYAHDNKDISWDKVSAELNWLKDIEDPAAQAFIDSSLSVFDSNHDELTKLVWWLHHAVTTGEYILEGDHEYRASFRATDVVPFCLNSVRLLDEFTAKVDSLCSCEHLLNTFWAHIKLSPLVRQFDPPELAEGETVAYDVSSCFKHTRMDALTLEEISWLAHINPGSVANAASLPKGKTRKLETFRDESQTLVDVSTAIDWLSKCPAFKPPKIIDQYHSIENEETVLVPVARDGSFLNYKCHRSKGYQIGPKGNEAYHPDLMETLELLIKNRNDNTPVRWRRPNENGIFGIVTAVRWEQRKKSEVFGNSKDGSISSK
ncbi:hypothetical protein [Endozoicomonas atrinae]|uniref:hypothetical protein n=1 Tax=Endozoicomonas atrinae TaxID=1333660 RepID=UPI0008241943|nr:hypothetical protein [Endozoicomonas atrinae]